MMELALAPASVGKYLSILSSIKFEKIQPRYDKHGIKSKYGGIQSFEGLTAFCRSWESVLEKASSQKKGLLVYVFG